MRINFMYQVAYGTKKMKMSKMRRLKFKYDTNCCMIGYEMTLFYVWLEYSNYVIQIIFDLRVFFIRKNTVTNYE